MTQARITINAVIGDNDDLPINQLVTLGNSGNGGELTYNWSILDQPPGSSDVLSSASIASPTFTPKKEGTYLLRLVVNQSLPDQQTDTVIAAVRHLKTRLRLPAAGETNQDDTARGWATDMNDHLLSIDRLLADPGIVVGVNASGGTLTRGDIVRATSTVTIKSGLPGQEKVPGFAKAPATLRANVDEMVCVVEGMPDGTTSVPNGSLVKARYIGRFEGQVISGVVGDTVYCSDSATIANASGTIRRQLGSIMAISGGIADIWFDGVGGYDITPIDAPYLVYGSSGLLTNAKRVDGTNATGATGAVPFVFRASDDNTVALVAKRNSASGLAQFQVQREDALVFASFANNVLEFRNDLSDADLAVLAEMHGWDRLSTAADKRAAAVIMQLRGTSGLNRGGKLSFQVKSDGLSGLTEAMNITTAGVVVTAIAANSTAVTATGLGTGYGMRGIGGNASGAGLRGEGGGPNGVGISGQGTGSGQGGVFVGGGSNGTGVQSTGVGTGWGVLGIADVGGAAVGVEGRGGNGTPGVKGVGQAGNGDGVYGTPNGTGVGVRGVGGSTGVGVRGEGTNSSGGVFVSTNNVGVFSQGTTYGVQAEGSLSTGVGIIGTATNGAASTVGVAGASGVGGAGSGIGTYGAANGSGGTGVRGDANGLNGIAVYGSATGSTGTGIRALGGQWGILAQTSGTGAANYAIFADADGAGNGYAIRILPKQGGAPNFAAVRWSTSSQPTSALIGDMYVDSSGTLHIYTSPGAWKAVQVA